MSRQLTPTCGRHRADELREAICDLVIQGKLDAVDLKIIAARDCSPMPSLREVARQLKIDAANISRRSQRIKYRILKEISFIPASARNTFSL